MNIHNHLVGQLVTGDYFDAHHHHYVYEYLIIHEYS